MNRLILLLILVLSLSACSQGDKPKAAPQKTIITKLTSSGQTLYFTGTIAPIKTTPVTAPMAGTVVTMAVSFGDHVTQGQPLLTIRSAKLEQDYRQVLTNYLKAKNSYFDAKAAFDNAKGLWQEGIISRDDFDAKKDALETSSLGFISAQYQLEQTLKQLKAKVTDIEALSLDNEAQIKAVLAKQYDAFTLTAPAAGVVLKPQTNQQNGSSPQQLQLGSSVKAHEIILSIGDLTGITTIAAINEMDINKIQVGQSAEITSPAFPQVLSGKVTAVGVQAKSNTNGGLVTFPATITVKQLTPQAQKMIRVGMSVKIAIHLSATQQIIIPLNAIEQKNGETVVTVIEASGEKRIIPVTTGATTLTGVTILHGLKPGMRVLLHN